MNLIWQGTILELTQLLMLLKGTKRPLVNLLNSWRLNGCEMYITLEPCPMCSGAIINSRLDKIYIGTTDEVMGACGTALNLLENYKFNHIVQVEKYILKEECSKILKNFFKILKNKK